MFADLWKNEDFQDRFLRRASELLKGPLTDQAILDEIDRLADEIEPEMARNQAYVHRSYDSWAAAVEALRTFVTNNNWARHNVDFICRELHLSKEVRDLYFSDIE